MTAAYGLDEGRTQLSPGLDVLAQALNRGDLGLAMIAAVQLKLPPLSWQGAIRIARADDLLAKYNSSEPRDWRGRWTDAAGSVGFEPQSKPRPKPIPERKPKPRRRPAVAQLHDQPKPTGGTGPRAQYPLHTVDELKPPPFERSRLSPARQKQLSLDATAALEGDLASLLTWNAAEAALGMGSLTDPGPGRLVNEWRTGTGPQRRILGPSSTFAQQFAIAPSTQGTDTDAIKSWRRRPGGLAGPKNKFSIIDVSGKFGPEQFVRDAVADNAAAHVIGSYNLAGIIDRDRIHWQATNDMGLHSFAAGSWADKFKLPTFIDNVDRPLPFGTTRQIIRWDSDLTGNLLRPR
jgi:hypothetical protein